MKNYGAEGEVQQRLSDHDDRLDQLESELDAEKFWNKSGNDLVIQEDVNGTIDKLDVESRRITGVVTEPTENSDAVNVEFAEATAIKYALIF